MSVSFDDLIKAHIEQGRAVAEDFRRCTEAEIARLEDRMGLQLPGRFKDYLRAMGRSPANILAGSDIRFGCLHLLTGEAREELNLNGVLLPADAFAFFAHQGYDYMYFLTADGKDDPPVHRFHIDWEAPRQVFAAFNDYVRWMFASTAEIPPDGLA